MTAASKVRGRRPPNPRLRARPLEPLSLVSERQGAARARHDQSPPPLRNQIICFQRLSLWWGPGAKPLALPAIAIAPRTRS
jgi:hypothetical protein